MSLRGSYQRACIIARTVTLVMAPSKVLNVEP